MMPFMKTTGRKIARIASDAADAAPVISRAPTIEACTRLIPVLVMAGDVLEHHDRVVDDDSDRERERQQREGIEREAERSRKMNAPISEVGIARMTLNAEPHEPRNR